MYRAIAVSDGYYGDKNSVVWLYQKTEKPVMLQNLDVFCQCTKRYTFRDLAFHVRLIAPALMTDEEIMKFQSSLREVMLFIKHSKDKEALREIFSRNRSRFRSLERRAMEVICDYGYGSEI